MQGRNWLILLCGCFSVALLHGAGREEKERLLRVRDSALLMGYPDDDTLFVVRDGEELRLRVPGTQRAGHHTYPSLSRDGTLVATSYVKSPSPHYREGIAVYSVVDAQWKQYDPGDFGYVLAITISPDGSTLAFKAEQHSLLQPNPQLLLLNLSTGKATVLIEPFHASAPLSWSPDGRRFVYEHPEQRPDGKFNPYKYEIRIRDLGNGQDHGLVSGTDPSWSPSGEWIAYLDSCDAVAIVHPDGTGATALISFRRRPPWFLKRYFMYAPVWSPDSKTLLLNEAAADETARAVIHQFDLEHRRLRRKAGKGVAVLGWTR